MEVSLDKIKELEREFQNARLEALRSPPDPLDTTRTPAYGWEQVLNLTYTVYPQLKDTRQEGWYYPKD